MAKNFGQLDKMAKDAEARKADLQKKIDALTAEKAKYHAEAEAAAAAGNVARYMELDAKEKEAVAGIYVFSKQRDAAEFTITAEDVRGAWADYAAEYTRTFGKEWAEYTKQREALYEKFMRVCDLQNQALKQRERCRQLVKDPAARFDMPMISGVTCQGLSYKNMNLRMPDAIFFMASGVVNDDAAEFFNSVLRNQKPF